jgi:OmpA-OmpF porin, OOP family
MKLQLLPALSALVLITACGGSDKAATAAPEANSPATAAAPDPTTTPAAAPEAKPAAFDLSTVAMSTATLGEFPYMAVPAGYEIYEQKTLDLAAFPIWTGGGFLTVEGRVYMAQSKTPEGKTFSRVEFERGIENAVTAAGGVRIVRGEVPNDAFDTLPNDLKQDARLGMGAMYGNPFAAYVIRRADRTIWIQTVTDTNVGNWTIIDAPLAQ